MPSLVPLARCETVTFTPSSVVPQGGDGAVVYSSGALDSFGTDDTPIDWPTTGAKIKAIEVEVTATDAFTGDGQIQTVVCQPGNLTAPISGSTSDASGTWSGWQGVVDTYRTSGVDAFYFNKIGGWRTDYLTFSGGGGTDTWLTSTSSITPGTGIDIRARVRAADWDGGTELRTVCSTPISLGMRHCSLEFTSIGIYLTMFNAAGTSQRTCIMPWSSFGETDGEWLGIRAVTDGTATATFYQDTIASEQLDNWASVGTASFGGTVSNVAATQIRVGSNNRSAAGLLGDLSHWQIRDGTGAIIHQLALDAMDASGDTAWASGSNAISRNASLNTANGSTIPATQRVRWVADTPFPADEVRLIVDAQTGALTVDEILIEAECGDRHRRGFGLIR